MGYNTVVVIYNDHIGEIERSGAFGSRLADTIRRWGCPDKILHGNFGDGKIISMDHADGYQITVVHGNTGRRIEDVDDLPPWQLENLAECLRRHNWRVKPPARQRKSAKSVTTGNIEE